MLSDIEVLRLAPKILNTALQAHRDRADTQPLSFHGLHLSYIQMAAYEIQEHQNYSVAIGHIYAGCVALEQFIPYTFQDNISFNLSVDHILLPFLRGIRR